MKALKDFDYNLWTTEENGVKKYFVGIKATGEVTEVDAEVMKLLRNEEKKMRRHIEEEIELGTPLSLDSAAGDESNSTWLTDSTNLQEEVTAQMLRAEFERSLTKFQLTIFKECMEGSMPYAEFAKQKGVHSVFVFRYVEFSFLLRCEMQNRRYI